MSWLKYLIREHTRRAELRPEPIEQFQLREVHAALHRLRPEDMTIAAKLIDQLHAFVVRS
jgi:hypothetical protein